MAGKVQTARSAFAVIMALVGLTVAIFFARSVYTMTPELDDPLIAWDIVKKISKSNELSLLLAGEHHSA